MFRFFHQPSFYILAAIFLISLGMLLFIHPKVPDSGILQQPGVYEAEVLEILSEKEVQISDGRTVREQMLRIRVPADSEVEEATVRNDYVPVEIGDRIFVQELLFETDAGSRFTIHNVKRDTGMAWLLGVFIGIVLFVAGRQGLRALLGLLFSIAIILKFMVPAIFAGFSPMIVGIGGALLILVVALYASHGFNEKSIAAFLGIGAALVLVAFLSNFSVSALNLTGYSEEAFYLNFLTPNTINFAGLLAAGIFIAVIGVLDDVAVTQASAVFTIASETKLRGWALFRKAMAVGHDHIAAVINTLFLAYAGAALPVLLLFSASRMPASLVLSNEIIAEEIVRTLVASIGLVIAIPITTFIAVFFLKK